MVGETENATGMGASRLFYGFARIAMDIWSHQLRIAAGTHGARFRDGGSFAKNTDGHRPTLQVFWGGGTPGAGGLFKILDNHA